MEIHKMDISIPYYEDVTRISNSNIGYELGYAAANNILTIIYSVYLSI